MGVCISKEHHIQVPPEAGPLLQSAIHKSVILDSDHYADIHKFYRFTAVIGHGHFGTVRQAYRFNNEAIPFAVKSICKENIRKDIYLLKREIDILMQVDHPNIIKYYESYEDDKYIHLVMEMCTGGDLLDKISSEGILFEDQLAPLMRKLFSAVNHLHGLYICHRDLKPENVLFSTKDLTAEVKLIDFGMSAKFGEDVTVMTTMVGTPHYLAPEVLSSKYGKECDVWSLGVMVYYLLTGCYPFDGKTLNTIFQSILKAEFDFSGGEWENISSECKDLVSKMLLVDPTQRITLGNALKHKWLISTRDPKPPQQVSRAVLRNLKAFKPVSKLQQEVMKLIVKNLSTEELQDLKNTFTALDTNDTGFVSAQDLENAMFQAGFNISAEDIRSNVHSELVHSVDELQQKGMKYSNFIMATIDRKKLLDREIVYMAFKHLDYVCVTQDNDGFITTKDLKTAMEVAGGEFTDMELQEMINEFDIKGDRQIDFEEFSEMMARDLHFRSGQRPSTQLRQKQQWHRLPAFQCPYPHVSALRALRLVLVFTNMKADSLESTPLKTGSQQPRRLPVILAVVTVVELVVLGCGVFMRPNFTNECRTAPLGTWSLVLLLFCLLHLGCSSTVNWIDQVCPLPSSCHLLLKIVEVGTLMVAAGWIGAGHYWMFIAQHCESIPSVAFPSTVLPLCDATALFCALLWVLSVLPRTSPSKPGLFD